jgi:hypothetical protein
MNALKLEAEAIDLYRELEAWFTDRNLDDLANLSARLATWHRNVYTRIAGTDDLMSVAALKEAAVPWVGLGQPGTRSHEFVWRLASPVQLLELALENEHSEECAAKLRAALGKVAPIDWEAALEAGETPALALGAERRLLR